VCDENRSHFGLSVMLNAHTTADRTSGAAKALLTTTMFDGHSTKVIKVTVT